MTRAIVTQLVEALEYVVDQGGGPLCEHEAGICFCKENTAINAAREYLATEPIGERAELIADLRGLIGLHTWARVVVSRAVIMLKADAQQAKPKDAELIAAYANLAEAELRANRAEAQHKSQCRITESALNERAQQSKLVPMTDEEKKFRWFNTTIEIPDGENCYYRGIADAEKHHGIK